MQDSPGAIVFGLYKRVTGFSAPFLSFLLARRLKNGKEIAQRVEEKKAVTRVARPPGRLVWIHAASVGEAQSALILIDKLYVLFPALQVLVTTGTVTSARILDGKLPAGAIHQFYPLDHPKWVDAFVSYWRPDLVFWMESELWPNMLENIRLRLIPAVLVNARISPRSLKTWRWAPSLAARTLSAFHLVLAQTEGDAQRLRGLGFSGSLTVTDNLKYSALPLGYDTAAFERLKKATSGRTLWVFASTHKGEEEMAARIHAALKVRVPNLLSVIVPRHPERRADIASALRDCGLKVRFRGEAAALPESGDDLYIADTLGELGLFYRLCPVACIGRSFSDDGGGGHNPLEAAHLHCAVLHGPNVQNLQQIYNEMDEAGGALSLLNEDTFSEALLGLFENPDRLNSLRHTGEAFARDKADVIERVMAEIKPVVLNALPGHPLTDKVAQG